MRTAAADVIAAAQAAQEAHGVPASISLAQWALESTWGARCTGKFNFFGVKALPGQPSTLCWTHEVVNGKSVAVQQPFRDYDDMAEAFDAHAVLLTGRRYAKAWPFTTRDAFVHAIAPSYATDPLYATKLLDLIRQDGFAVYDQVTPS